MHFHAWLRASCVSASVALRQLHEQSRLTLLREALRGIPNFPGLTLTRADGFAAPAAVGKRTVKEELTDYTPKVMVTVPIAAMHRVRHGSDMLAE